MRIRLLRLLSLTVFFLGVMVGLALAVVLVWNRLEAINYYFTGAKYEPFNGLRCPILMSPTEKAFVTAIFNNSTDREDNFLYRTEISGTVSTRQIEGQVAVAPRQTRSAQFAVDINDVDLMFFIFVKMNILPNALHPSQEAVCGILVANILGLTGRQLFISALSLSLSGIAIGLGVWQQTSTNADQNIRRILLTLGVVVLLAMSTGLMGWWMMAIAFSALTILLIVISLRFAFA